MATLRVLEIRTYRLRPGTRDAFHHLVAAPIAALARYGVTVVDYGPSTVTEDGHEDFYLIRAFASVAERQRQEEAFYGSEQWRGEWRDDILACIESFHTVVMNVTPEAIAALTRPR